MSAFGAIKDHVEAAVKAVVAVLNDKDTEQDIAIKALQDRVSVLEGRLSPPEAKVSSVSVKRPAAKARAGTAKADGGTSGA